MPLHYPAIRELTGLKRQLSAGKQFPAGQVVQRRGGNRQPAVALKHAAVIQNIDRQRGITRRQLTCVIQPCGRQVQPLLSEQPSTLLVRQLVADIQAQIARLHDALVVEIIEIKREPLLRKQQPLVGQLRQGKRQRPAGDNLPAGLIVKYQS